MKKSTLLLILLAIGLAVVAGYLILRKNSSSFREELRDFAVADTGSITKIFLADKNNNSITLERKGLASWTVNGKEPARQGGINQIMATIRRVAVKTRVPKTGYNVIVTDLAASAIKCEIYTTDPNKPEKVYFVGGPTQDMVGTYMMLENSKVPFVTEIPGFNGYLTSRYTVQLNDWRDRVVFAEDPAAITSVSIDYPGDPRQSFRIERQSGVLKVFPAQGNQPLQVDPASLLNYLDFFRLLPFEDWSKSFKDARRDSLAASQPLAIISVTSATGTKSAVLHPMPVNERSLIQQDEKGKPLKYDVDRMLAFIQGGKELVVIQYFSFGKVLRKLDEFKAMQKQ